eukprot:symbB.v1.2.001720.t1/scaffold61.1/size362833/19
MTSGKMPSTLKVGSYYQSEDGVMQALDGLVNDSYDRAAPLGCGDCKAAGNYAADLESMHAAKRLGYPISLYLDARERRYVEEFNTSNFVAITKDQMKRCFHCIGPLHTP